MGGVDHADLLEGREARGDVEAEPLLRPHLAVDGEVVTVARRPGVHPAQELRQLAVEAAPAELPGEVQHEARGGVELALPPYAREPERGGRLPRRPQRECEVPLHRAGRMRPAPSVAGAVPRGARPDIGRAVHPERHRERVPIARSVRVEKHPPDGAAPIVPPLMGRHRVRPGEGLSVRVVVIPSPRMAGGVHRAGALLPHDRSGAGDPRPELRGGPGAVDAIDPGHALGAAIGMQEQRPGLRRVVVVVGPCEGVERGPQGSGAVERRDGLPEEREHPRVPGVAEFVGGELGRLDGHDALAIFAARAACCSSYFRCHSARFASTS